MFHLDQLPSVTFCGPARDTVLTNRQTEKLNFDTNYITMWIVYLHEHKRLFIWFPFMNIKGL
jgi:hypothetical protein